MKVGFIGLGVMGAPMVRHLLRAGHGVRVFARRRETLAPFVAAGAHACGSPAEAAAGADAVFTVVTTTADVREVMLGPQGVIHGATPGTVAVDLSTIAPAAARDIATALAAKGIEFLDAPVSGGGAGAKNATLAIMVGGEAAALARVRPLLECLGKTIVHIGPAGAGQVAKACNQMIMVAAIEACAEAARLAAASGVDFGRVRAAMEGGSAGSRVLEFFGDKMARRDFSAGVEARLHHKDYAIVMEAAAALGAPLPVAAVVGQQLNALMAQGWGQDDTASLLRLLEAAAPAAGGA